jgi:hypothetical protein
MIHLNKVQLQEKANTRLPGFLHHGSLWPDAGCFPVTQVPWQLRSRRRTMERE